MDRTAVSAWMGFRGEALGLVLRYHLPNHNLVLMALQQAAKWLPGDGIIEVQQPIAVYSSIQTPCIADNLANVACVRSAPVVRLTFQHPAAWKTLKILGAMPW